jgi:hypothetical protein
LKSRASFAVGFPEEFAEFFVDDLDDLLSGRQALENFLADCLGPDVPDEVFDDLKVDVSLKEGKPYLLQREVDVFLF